MSDDLVRRLRNLVALNGPEHGGPYRGTAATLCVEAMAEAADEIERLRKLLQSLADEGATVHGFYVSDLPRVREYSDIRLKDVTDT